MSTQPFGGAKFIYPLNTADRPHIFGFTTARTAAADPIFELWNGATVAARVLWADRDGSIYMKHASLLKGANNAGTPADLLGVNTSNQVVLGNIGMAIKLNRALTALGGGIAPTLGTIGGSGPAVAAQDAWLTLLDDSGTAYHIAVWR